MHSMNNVPFIYKKIHYGPNRHARRKAFGNLRREMKFKAKWPNGRKA